MRIAYLATDNNQLTKRVYDGKIAEVMTENGNDVLFISPQQVEWKIPPTSEAFWGTDKPLPKTVMDKVIKFKPEIAFVSSIYNLSQLFQIVETTGAKSVVQIKDVPVWRLYWEQWKTQWDGIKKALLQCDRLVVNSNFVKGQVQWFLGSSALPINVVYYGVDIEEIDNAPNEEKRAEIVFCSRIVFYKGLDLILYALKTLNDPPTLNVIGDGDDLFRLIQTAQIMGLRKVQWLGALDEKTKYTVIKRSLFGVTGDYNRHVGSLFPSECLGAGVPCLTHDIEIQRERCGEHLEYADFRKVENIGEKIWQLMQAREYLKENGAEGRKFILENRTTKHHAMGLLEAFKF